jgi:hypothetical protein
MEAYEGEDWRAAAGGGRDIFLLTINRGHDKYRLFRVMFLLVV